MTIWALLLLFTAGITGGLLAGLFGIGGGVIYVLVYNIYLVGALPESTPEELIVQLTILNAACSILAAACVGSYRQYRNNNFYPSRALAMGLASAATAFITTYVVSRWKGYSQDIFLTVFTLSLMPLVLKFIRKKSDKIRPAVSFKVYPLTGIIAGIGSALSGLGGGFITNPILHGLFKLHVKRTFSVSLGAMIFTALGIILYHMVGSGQRFNAVPLSNYNGILYITILPVIAGVMAGTPVGIHLYRRFTARMLSWMFFSLALIIIIRNIFVILT